MSYLVNACYEQEHIHGCRGAEFSKIAVVSAEACPTSLFLHLEGTYLARADNLACALARGCRIFVAPSFPAELLARQDLTLISTKDPIAELYRLANLFRLNSRAKVIAVTGSSGKTTCKDMIAFLLRQRYTNTLKTYRNYNGLLGVPLTVRKMRADDAFAVVEIGMGEPGTLAKAAELVRPDVGVITNIGVSHIGKYGTQKNIAREKGTLLPTIASSGIAILNGDDRECRELGGRHPGKTIYYGYGADNDLVADNFAQTMTGLTFSVRYGGQKTHFSLPCHGYFQVYNALAALTVGLYFGLTLAEMSVRLHQFTPATQRLRHLQLGDTTLLDDGYNSNPLSLAAALQALTSLPIAPKQKVAVIGDMQELGRLTTHYYEELRMLLLSLDVGQVILVGPLVQKLARQLPNATTAKTPKEIVVLLQSLRVQGSVILLKGQDDMLFASIRDEIMSWSRKAEH